MQDGGEQDGVSLQMGLLAGDLLKLRLAKGLNRSVMFSLFDTKRHRNDLNTDRGQVEELRCSP